MDAVQIVLGVALLAVSSLMLAGQYLSDSRAFLYFLTAAALLATVLAASVAVLRKRRATGG